MNLILSMLNFVLLGANIGRLINGNFSEGVVILLSVACCLNFVAGVLCLVNHCRR